MPRIAEAYKYSDEELLIVSAISKRKDLSPDDWNDPSLTELKLKLKKHYRAQQQGQCCYCSFPLPRHPRGYDLEHIISREQAVCYMLWPQNLAACCVDCNFAKGVNLSTKTSSIRKRTYPSWRDISVVHPHLDEYNENIAVIRGLFLGLERKGATTIAQCNLTRFHDEALRKIVNTDTDEKAYVEILSMRTRAASPSEKALLDTLIALHSKQRAPNANDLLSALQLPSAVQYAKAPGQ